ncbi:hypothetical protein C0J52_27118, partial [Blattella germanica]
FYHNSCAKLTKNIVFVDENSIRCCVDSVKANVENVEKYGSECVDEVETDIKPQDVIEDNFYIAIQDTDNEKVDIRIVKYINNQTDHIINTKDKVINELKEMIQMLNQHVVLLTKFIKQNEDRSIGDTIFNRVNGAINKQVSKPIATTLQSGFNNRNINKNNSTGYDSMNKSTKVSATVNLVADRVDRGEEALIGRLREVNKRNNYQTGKTDLDASQALRENNSELSINNTRHEKFLDNIRNTLGQGSSWGMLVLIGVTCGRKGCTSNFGFLSSKITQLEYSGIQLSDAVNIVKYTGKELKSAKGTVAANVRAKFVTVLEKKPGFSELYDISEILCGNKPSSDLKLQFSPCDISSFKYAPITSCDVGRSFSRYKSILSDNRRGFSFNNLQMHVVIGCNNPANAD